MCFCLLKNLAADNKKVVTENYTNKSGHAFICYRYKHHCLTVLTNFCKSKHHLMRLKLWLI